jgi:hypothetical protein
MRAVGLNRQAGSSVHRSNVNKVFNAAALAGSMVPIACASVAPPPTSEAPSASGDAPVEIAVTIPPVAPVPRDLAPVGVDDVCVTAGHLDAPRAHPSALEVDSAGMRAVVPGDSGVAAEVAFTYRGASHETTPLANGEVRRQIGLKLRARDTCNLVYVMWHVDPTPGVFVSIKHNPGQSTHEACGAGGYINLPSSKVARELPRVEIGSKHTIRAELDGITLRVRADGVVVWENDLPPEAFTFDGPGGVRTDNGAFDFELRLPASRTKTGCMRDGPSD